MQNKVRSNQTVAFEVVEHDTGDYNTLEVGYDSNDKVDAQSVSDWLSNNSYTNAYILNFRKENDQILASETTAANRLTYNPNQLSIDSATSGNNFSLKYELSNYLTIYNSLIFAYVFERKPSASNPGVKTIITNKGTLFIQIENIIEATDNLGEGAASTVDGNNINYAMFYYERFVNPNGGEFYCEVNNVKGASDSTPSTFSGDIEHIFDNHRGLSYQYEIIAVTNTSDYEKIQAYIRHNYNNSPNFI
jgi:hypothetical protein